MLAPIVLFVYNRPWHTQQTVEALQQCELAEKSELYIYADGPKKDATEEVRNRIVGVRQYIHTISGFKSIQIKESEENIGLANSVIQGVSDVLNKQGRVIVVEDDIVVHPFFLRFMNDALDCYERFYEIFAISTTMERFQIPSRYKRDVFLTYRFGSWGWAIWADRWNTINWDIDRYDIVNHRSSKLVRKFNRGGADLWQMLLDQKNGIIDSWAIRLGYNMSLQKRFCLRPIKSLVKNIGMDGTGIHCGGNAMQFLPLYDSETYSIELPMNVCVNRKITRNIQLIFAREKDATTSIIKRGKGIAKKVLVDLHLYRNRS